MDAIKLIHLGFAAASISGFLLHGTWSLLDHPHARRRMLTGVLRLVDGLLLFSGIWLAVTHVRHPLNDPWLVSKLGLIATYVGLVQLALQATRSIHVRMTALLAAILCFGTAVAIARHGSWAV